MSRHYFDTEYKTLPVQVILGYDRPLDEFFMQVKHLDMKNVEDEDLPFVYATIDDPEHDPLDLDYCRRKLVELGITIPETMYAAVQDDGRKRMGNFEAMHFADGSNKVLVPGQARR